nr:MAG TPA: hypothetical protein [Caudoviricetes sp.]
MESPTKQQLKRKKQEIVENTAINVGYATAVFNQIPAYAMIAAVRENVDLIPTMKTETDVMNLLVTESVRHMNYQDFKDIEQYFFN